MKLKAIHVLLYATLIANAGSAQSTMNNKFLQDSLGKLSSVIWKQKTDSARLNASTVFFEKFHSVLNAQSVGSTSFDSIPGITIAKSEDGKLCVYSWNVPVSDGSNKYFAFIQLTGDSSGVIPLVSGKTTSGESTNEIYTPESWYGALYYKIIDVKISGRTVYTVLGWDGYTKEANRKLIDIISINNDGDIIFGMPVFKTENGVKSRIILEYADKANLLLRYDYQAIRVEKRKKIKKENAWLIVMDRLVPMDPSLKGIRKYYVPSGDTYDGFLFRNGYWTLVEDIEVANKTMPSE